MNGLHACFGTGAFIAPLDRWNVCAPPPEIFTGCIGSLPWLALPIALFIWNLPSPQPRLVPEKHKNAAFPFIPVLVMTICFILYVGGEVGYGNWIYTYTFKSRLGTEAQSNYLTTAFWVSSCSGVCLRSGFQPAQTAHDFFPLISPAAS